LAHYLPEYTVLAPERPIRHMRVANLIRRIATWPYRATYGDPDRIPAPFGNGRVLDVGCGAGNYLGRLSACGWEAHGLDFDADVLRLARSRVPEAIIHHGTLENFQASAPFAYIALHHVLEHVQRPRDVLRRCYELLDNNGLMSISVPNIDSFEARLFGTRWRGLDIPRHLIHFSTSTLVALVRQQNFCVTMVRPALFASSLSESILLSLPMALKRRVFRNNRIRTAVYYLAVLPASVSYVIGNDPVLELEARKHE
jgi:2-polyprenyl-3-methyl-5-hydroxy-6-metoxy-1,4-benzoquinol methylase